MSGKQARTSDNFIEALPHVRALGIEVTHMEDGVAQLEMDYDERFIGDPSTGVVSGGVISALVDTCCGAAVMAHPEVAGATATIGLRLDYMRAATPGQRLSARARVYHLTSNVAFVRAEAFDLDRTTPVAAATGTFAAEKKS